MKSHVIVKINNTDVLPDLPHWSDILNERKQVSNTFFEQIDQILERYNVRVFPTREFKPKNVQWSPEEIASGVNRVYRLILQDNKEIPEIMIRDISLLPAIEKIYIGQVGYSNLPKSKTFQLSRPSDKASRKAIFLEQAHRFTRGDPAITIAVLDTGVSTEHPELEHALDSGFDFVDIISGARDFIGDKTGLDSDPEDEVGHGTHVAGIIAGKGIHMPLGVVPRCRILPVRVLATMKKEGRKVGAGLVDNINSGIKWAIDRGADLINMSLGIRHTGGGLPHEEVVEYARKMGVTIVAASGNDGREELYYPGALKGVIAVGALGENGEVADYSTYGRQVSFVAPGTNIYSCYINDGYSFSTGTSHASPFVTGGVAMMKSFARKFGKKLTDSQVKHVLKHTADKIDRRLKHPRAGYGKLNLVDALRLLQVKLS